MGVGFHRHFSMDRFYLQRVLGEEMEMGITKDLQTITNKNEIKNKTYPFCLEIVTVCTTPYSSV